MNYQSVLQNMLDLANTAIEDIWKPAVETMKEEDPLFESEGWEIKMTHEVWCDKDNQLTFYDMDSIDLNEGIRIECLYAMNKDSWGWSNTDTIIIPWSWINGEKTAEEMRQEAIDFLTSKMNGHRKSKRESDRRMFERLKEEYGW